MQKFWEERVKKYDGGTKIATKSIDVDEGFSETKDINNSKMLFNKTVLGESQIVY